MSAAMTQAVKTLEAVYELPYLAHVPMEPLNCVADVRPDGCDVWTGTQGQTFDHYGAVEITGLKPEQVRSIQPCSAAALAVAPPLIAISSARRCRSPRLFKRR